MGPSKLAVLRARGARKENWKEQKDGRKGRALIINPSQDRPSTRTFCSHLMWQKIEQKKTIGNHLDFDPSQRENDKICS